MSLFPPIMEALAAVGRDDALVIAGGTIPAGDLRKVKEMGVAAVFGPGTRLQDAIAFVRQHTGGDTESAPDNP